MENNLHLSACVAGHGLRSPPQENGRFEERRISDALSLHSSLIIVRLVDNNARYSWSGGYVIDEVGLNRNKQPSFKCN